MRQRSVTAVLLTALVAGLLAGIPAAPAAGGAWFGAPTNLGLPDTPWVAVAGDVDGDGRADLVVSSYRPRQVTVLRNTAAGWWRDSYASGGSSQLVLADLNGDGRPEIITPSEDSDSALLVHRNLGDGRYAETTQHALDRSPGSVATGDVDGDGHADVAVTALVDGASGVLILRGDGHGGLTPAGTYERPEPRDLILADLSGDGRPDLIVPHLVPGGIEVRLNRGDGTFGTAKEYAAGGKYPISAVTADFDGDGRTDVAVLHRDEVAIAPNAGNGALASPKLYPSAPPNIGTGDLTAGDLDGDGRIDLAFSVYGNNSASVVANLGDGRFGDPVLYPVHLTPQSVAIADFDVDGRPDLALVNNDSDDLSILYQSDSPPPPDLELGMMATPEVNAGNTTLLNARLNNRGPVAATGVGYRVELPGGAALVAAESPGHRCYTTGIAAICALGLVPAGDEVNISLRISVSAPGRNVFPGHVTAVEGDPDPADNRSHGFTEVAPAAETVAAGQDGITQVAGEAQTVDVTVRTAGGRRVADGTPVALTVTGATGTGPLTGPAVGMAASPSGRGYWLAGADGSVSAQGDARHFGDAAGHSGAAPMTGMASTPNGAGYWLVDADGAVRAFGDARHLGQLDGRAGSRPVVGMAATPSGAGYWLAGSDGSVAAFGDAASYGSKEGKPLDDPIAGLRPTPSGRGYWLFGTDGAVHPYGDARQHGQMSWLPLTSPIVDLVPTPTGGGYWFLDSSGGVFAEGDAVHHGNPAGRFPASGYLRAMSARPDGRGYWVAGEDGAVFAYGDAAFLGPVTTGATFEGEVTLTYTSLRPGATVVHASVAAPGGRVASAPLATTWVPGSPESVTVDPPASTALAGTTRALTATVADRHGNPVADGTALTVTASGTGGETPRSQSSPIASGRVQFSVASQKPGRSTVAVRAGSASGQATVDWLAEPTVPSPPRDVRATAGERSARVTWTAPDFDGGRPLTGYTVTASPGGRSVSAGPGATSVDIDGLTPGTAHTFIVAAHNALGTGAASAASAAVAPFAPAGDGRPQHRASVPSGYWMVGADGAVFGFGAAAYLGAPTLPAGVETTDIEPSPAGGYWILDQRGVVHAYGSAAHHGNADASRLAVGERATSLSATPRGAGYWIFTTRGRAIPRGDATFFGDMVGTALNAPVLDSVPTPTGSGYYMVAADGGIFTFGDARFRGSTGAMKLNAPVQSLVPDGDGDGYWLVASDGGIFAFDAPFHGSMGAVRLNRPVTGMVRYGDGYLMVGEDGGIFNFSPHPFSGSLGDNPPARPVVAVAALQG